MGCKAIKKNGKQCSNNAIPGEEYCGIHLRVPESIKDSLKKIEDKTEEIIQQNKASRKKSFVLGTLSSLLASILLKNAVFLKNIFEKTLKSAVKFIQFIIVFLIKVFENLKNIYDELITFIGELDWGNVIGAIVGIIFIPYLLIIPSMVFLFYFPLTTLKTIFIIYSSLVGIVTFFFLMVYASLTRIPKWIIAASLSVVLINFFIYFYWNDFFLWVTENDVLTYFSSLPEFAFLYVWFVIVIVVDLFLWVILSVIFRLLFGRS